MIVEIGGTVGDIESLPFLEAIRQFRHDVGRENAIFVHLTLVPYIAAAGELKTKPTQHSVRELMEIGIQPDILIVPHRAPALRRHQAQDRAVLQRRIRRRHRESRRADDLRDPARASTSRASTSKVLQKFGIERPAPDLAHWREMVQRIVAPHERVRIAVVGKYTDYVDSYKSVQEALIHGGIANDVGVDISWMSSDVFIERRARRASSSARHRRAARAGRLRRARRRGNGRGHPRTRASHGVPFFGICLGMQTAIIEFARNVLRARRQPLAASSRPSATTRSSR